MQSIKIRPVKGITECHAVTDLQVAAWGFTPADVIPAHSIAAIIKSGGIVLGAFGRSLNGDRLIGFALGWTGLRGGRPYHYSDMLAVLPEYQEQGIGRALKLAQREAALAQGLELMSWTYDPLVARNAWFNIVKLGCTVREYVVNLYGEMQSATHAGLPTDRFSTEWWLRSARVMARVSRPRPDPHPNPPPRWGRENDPHPDPAPSWEREFAAPDPYGSAAALIDEPDQPHDQLPPDHQLITITEPYPASNRLVGLRLEVAAALVWAEIPAHIEKLKEADLDAALDWRRQTRRLFQEYFARGYTITGMTRIGDGAAQRVFYQLEASKV
jgi:predicted GNAT superfamily acetyltransferase